MTDAELRELDVRVHREVMGGKVKWEYGHPYTPTMTLVPHYSSDIAAAWRVVEKLRERWRVDLFVKKPGEIVACCIEDRPWYGETVPIAICRAALECVKGVQS